MAMHKMLKERHLLYQDRIRYYLVLKFPSTLCTSYPSIQEEIVVVVSFRL